MQVKLINYSKEYDKVLPLAVSQCYKSQPSMKAVKHCITANHLSVLEHCMATFQITCSLQTLLQITRHRHLSFTVQSSRGSQLTDLTLGKFKDINHLNLEQLKAYNRLLAEGVPYEECAYMLPKAINYSFVVSGNLRAWFEYLPKRLCKRTQEEHQVIATNIHRELAQVMPEIFDREMLNCAQCKESACTFHKKNGGIN